MPATCHVSVLISVTTSAFQTYWQVQVVRDWLFNLSLLHTYKFHLTLVSEDLSSSHIGQMSTELHSALGTTARNPANSEPQDKAYAPSSSSPLLDTIAFGFQHTQSPTGCLRGPTNLHIAYACRGQEEGGCLLLF